MCLIYRRATRSLGSRGLRRNLAPHSPGPRHCMADSKLLSTRWHVKSQAARPFTALSNTHTQSGRCYSDPPPLPWLREGREAEGDCTSARVIPAARVLGLRGWHAGSAASVRTISHSSRTTLLAAPLQAPVSIAHELGHLVRRAGDWCMVRWAGHRVMASGSQRRRLRLSHGCL